MFRKFRRPTLQPANRKTAVTPADTVVWCVGDVHGCLDLLSRLTSAVLEDVADRGGRKAHIVFLGDYIDRGPDSRGVLNELARLTTTEGLTFHFLRGNHEAQMEAFLVDPRVGPDWCSFGGRATLGSFEITPPATTDGDEAWEEASRQLRSALTDDLWRFLGSQKASVSIGDFFFAHAGAEPGVSLSDQDPKQLMWIRRSFLEDKQPFEKMIVHGHTPVDRVHVDHRRIGIDTGAYATGVLTALRLEGAARELLQTSRRGSDIYLSRSPLMGVHARHQEVPSAAVAVLDLPRRRPIGRSSKK